MSVVLVNGQFMNREQVAIDFEDRGYQFGDGVYEVAMVYGGRFFKLDEHLVRLRRSANEIGFELPYSLGELNRMLHQLCSRNKFMDGMVYFQVSRGVAPRAHPFPPATVVPQLIGYTKKNGSLEPIQQQGVCCILTEDIRWLRCDIKSLNLLGNVMAKQRAVVQGAFEAILHRGDTVTEGSSTNVFIVKKGVLYTHPANHLILHGITRQSILEIAASLHMEVSEESFTTHQLFAADEIFITSTTSEVVPVIEVDGKRIGAGMPGVHTKKILQHFKQTTR